MSCYFITRKFTTVQLTEHPSSLGLLCFNMNYTFDPGNGYHRNCIALMSSCEFTNDWSYGRLAAMLRKFDQVFNWLLKHFGRPSKRWFFLFWEKVHVDSRTVATIHTAKDDTFGCCFTQQKLFSRRTTNANFTMWFIFHIPIKHPKRVAHK